MNGTLMTLGLYISAAEGYEKKGMHETAQIYYEEAATLFNMLGSQS